MSIGNPVSLTNNVAAKTISVTATTGQTLFTVAGGYRINQLSVYRNGTRLVDSQDYTARDGTTVTLLSPASTSDVIEFQVFDDFRVADALDVNSGGTVNGNVTVTGIVSATSFYGDGTNLTNTGSTLSAASGSQRLVLTSQTSGTMTASSTDADLTWDASTNTLSATNVSIAGTLTYEDVTNVDSIGLVTARNGAIVNAGTATTALIVNGDARVTGILTIGTSSITLNGSSNQVNVGAGVTIYGNTGIISATKFYGDASGLTGVGIGSTGSINTAGIITATSFSGDGSALTGVGGGSSITKGNTSAQVIDTGSDGRFVVTAEGNEALRVDSSGRLLLGTTTGSARMVVEGAIKVGQTLLFSKSGFNPLVFTVTTGGNADIGGVLEIKAIHTNYSTAYGGSGRWLYRVVGPGNQVGLITSNTDGTAPTITISNVNSTTYTISISFTNQFCFAEVSILGSGAIDIA